MYATQSSQKIWQLILKNKARFTFGLANGFFSGYGQTFFIALLLPILVKKFSLTESVMSTYYSVITLISAALLGFTGKYADHISLKKYAIPVNILLIIGMIALGFSPYLWMCLIALFFIRHAGQAQLGHLNTVAFSRVPVFNRGKALAVAALGLPLSEAILPPSFVWFNSSVGIENALLIYAFILLSVQLVIIPIILPPADDIFHNTEKKPDDISPNWMYFFKNRNFLCILLPYAIMPFFMTAIFYHQKYISAQVSSDPFYMAKYFFLFAGARTFSLFFAGQLIDRYTARRVFPLSLTPLIVGLFILAYLPAAVSLPIFLVLSGLSIGVSATAKPALSTEIFGSKIIGTVKAITSPLTVVATAASPIIYAILIDTNVSYFNIMLSMGIAAAAMMLPLLGLKAD